MNQLQQSYLPVLTWKKFHSKETLQIYIQNIFREKSRIINSTSKKVNVEYFTLDFIISFSNADLSSSASYYCSRSKEKDKTQMSSLISMSQKRSINIHSHALIVGCLKTMVKHPARKKVDANIKCLYQICFA